MHAFIDRASLSEVASPWPHTTSLLHRNQSDPSTATTSLCRNILIEKNAVLVVTVQERIFSNQRGM